MIKLWGKAEREWMTAPDRDAAKAAAEPLVRLCGECHAQADCALWARMDGYSGIAAGSAWVNGVPRRTSWLFSQRHRGELGPMVGDVEASG